jgi:hypothetical protein
MYLVRTDDLSTNLYLKAYLSISSESVSQEPLVVLGNDVEGDVEGLVEELVVGHAVADVDNAVILIPFIPGENFRKKT